MAVGLVFQFSGVDAQQYDAVNEKLGFDPSTRQGSWPAGLLTHMGGTGDDGVFYVVELWESKALQEQFFAARLGPALGAVGVAAPTKVAWVDIAGEFRA
jgi:hypothetical protein